MKTKEELYGHYQWTLYLSLGEAGLAAAIWDYLCETADYAPFSWVHAEPIEPSAVTLYAASDKLHGFCVGWYRRGVADAPKGAAV